MKSLFISQPYRFS